MAETEREKPRMRSVRKLRVSGADCATQMHSRENERFCFHWISLTPGVKVFFWNFYCLSPLLPQYLFLLPSSSVPLTFLSANVKGIPIICSHLSQKIAIQELHLWLSWPWQPHSFILSNPSPTFALGQTSASLGWSLSLWTSWNRTNASTILLANPNWCPLPDSQDGT